ncbi:DUF1611 domain-containing protein [Alkalicoccus halolimnae]|uniref:DUF1611 domain-containing protein n=1 Tax=Alkalicoccus halolimnae TaxID=1667239 RepID=A0A5C7F4H1_9BACI|nr:DUF1611 domain-containing protein [Alkalicoccus halolimnae]TXF84654.1 DUF1611 domain-containing protein [Alkalicoccus halolimnae]
MNKTALIYCEGNFGTMDGKTANGLIRSSGNYTIAGVIDSTKTGEDTGQCLENKTNGIPFFTSLENAFELLEHVPDQFIFGMAPSAGLLKSHEREVVLKAMERGMDITNPLHEFFTDDSEFRQQAAKYGVQMTDVRKPPEKKDMHLFSGRILDIKTPIVAVLGTDSAVGKRTTSVLLEEALENAGLKVAFIATGQTGLIQGKKYGTAIDAIPSQFMTGEIENQVLRAHDELQPDIMIVEGQGALSHPAYISSCGIIRGSRPGSVIIQHPPKRENLGDFSYMPMPSLESEMELIESFSCAKVTAISINHENMTASEVQNTITDYEKRYDMPTTDVLQFGCGKLVRTIFDTYPQLENKRSAVSVN